MSKEFIKQHMASLNDEQLLAAFDEAVKDCNEAAETDPESEWHQECFAGVLAYSIEVANRGLRKPTTH